MAAASRCLATAVRRRAACRWGSRIPGPASRPGSASASSRPSLGSGPRAGGSRGPGRRGLELARNRRPDLILPDLHLPDMSGRDVLAALRDEPSTRDIPVVILSADATAHQIERLLAEGARHYLTKPLDVQLLLTLLD